MSPSPGLAATPAHPPPPSDPGKTSVGSIPYGVYGPMFTDLSYSSVQYFSDSGEILLTSFRVMASRVSPAGFSGNGCVGHASSPGASKRGTGRSSIPKIGSPV